MTETKAVAVNRRTVERIKAALADPKIDEAHKAAYEHWLPVAEELLAREEAKAIEAYNEAVTLGYIKP